MRRAFTWIELVVAVLVVVVLLALLGGDVAGLPFYFLFGWAWFLGRAVPRMDPAWDQVAVFAVGVVALTVLCHLLLRRTDAGRWSNAVRLVGLALLVFVAGTAFVGLTHQVGWALTDPEPWIRDRRGGYSVVQNRLKQIAIGVHNALVDKEGHLPPGFLADRHGEPLHGWPTVLLPYLEEEALFKRIDRTRPWDDPANAAAVGKRIQIYEHPTRPEELAHGLPAMAYAANVHVLGGDRPRRIEDFAAVGAENVVLVAEVATDLRPWASPVHQRDPALGLGHRHGFGTRTPGGLVQVAMLDGSVRRVKVGEDDAAFRAMTGARR